MATHFLPLSKNMSCTSTPQGKHLCQISWELVKNWGSSSRRKIFPPFCHNMPLPWQHTFCHCPKNVSCTSTPQGKHLCQISWELVKNWGSSSRRKIFPPFLQYAVTMATHFLPLSKKCVLHIYTPRQTSVPNFMRIGQKLREVVCDARLAPDRPTDDTLIPNTPLYTTCMRGVQKLSYVVRDAEKCSGPCTFCLFYYEMVFPSRQPVTILLYSSTMRRLWNKPSYHICLDYRMENNMKLSTFSSTELP